MGEGICKRHTWYRTGIQNVFKNSQQLENKQFKKCAKDLNRHLTKEDIQITNKHIKNTSHIIREI